MESLGFAIFLSVVVYVDYNCYLRGNDSIFFKDKTILEKNIREIQELKIKKELEDLKK